MIESVSAGVLIRYFNAIQNSNSGKDKALRLLQYTIRLASRILSKHSLAAVLEKFLQRLAHLEGAISISRNVFSFGNCFESLMCALDALAIADDSLRVWSVISHSAKFFHLSADHLNLLQKIKVAHISDVLPIWVNRLWILSAFLSLARNMRHFKLLCGDMNAIQVFTHFAAQPSIRANLPGSMFRKFDLNTPCASKGSSQISESRLNLYKDILDLTCPLSNLGYVRAEVGAVSGILSSVIGLMQIIKKVN
ncbi:uncharacterized protein LOC142339757 [Convolutriloba macropyga]|uniref:uncharacterized protein LOC142339757 n=1 Tax=Convolutriloba macropyga TaxID=536237 RepID=UPI003F51CBE1